MAKTLFEVAELVQSCAELARDAKTQNFWIWKNLDNCCKVMAKYISIHFDVFHLRRVGSDWLQATSETKIVS